MYIKLTRLDNTPIWINASFIVTIEPRRGGGATVVPIGDGLDYDVREQPDAVLAMLGDAPAPAVVPVPVSDCLTALPADVSPELETSDPAVQEPSDTSVPEKPARKSRTTRRKPSTEDAAATVSGQDAEPEKPVRKPRAPKKSRKAGAMAEPETEASADSAAEPPPADSPLTEEEIARLRKMMPRSVRKLRNTLVSQFKTVEVETVIQSLVSHGVFTIEQDDHLVWRM